MQTFYIKFKSSGDRQRGYISLVRRENDNKKNPKGFALDETGWNMIDSLRDQTEMSCIIGKKPRGGGGSPL